MLDNVRADLEGAVASIASSSIPTVVYENVSPKKTTKEYIRPTIAFSPTATDVGYEGSSRLDGTLIIQVFTAVGKGTGKAFQIADTLSTALANKTFTNGTTTRTGSIRSVGIDQEARGFYQHNLIIPFRFFTGPDVISQ